MNIKQKVLKKVYPAFMKVSKLLNMQSASEMNHNRIKPQVPFDSLSFTLNNGERIGISDFRNMKVMIVNTASECGYTAQYAELQELYRRFADRLVIIAFPSNDFKEQEKASDAEIASFCQVNFGVTFPLAKKSSVLKGLGQEKVFEWLTNAEMNGWNNLEPKWNFSKYLIDEQGRLMYTFDPSVSPLSDEVLRAIEH